MSGDVPDYETPPSCSIALESTQATYSGTNATVGRDQRAVRSGE
jgi:hypothetical protein